MYSSTAQRRYAGTTGTTVHVRKTGARCASRLSASGQSRPSPQPEHRGCWIFPHQISDGVDPTFEAGGSPKGPEIHVARPELTDSGLVIRNDISYLCCEQENSKRAATVLL